MDGGDRSVGVVDSELDALSCFLPEIARPVERTSRLTRDHTSRIGHIDHDHPTLPVESTGHPAISTVPIPTTVKTRDDSDDQRLSSSLRRARLPMARRTIRTRASLRQAPSRIRTAVLTVVKGAGHRLAAGGEWLRNSTRRTAISFAGGVVLGAVVMQPFGNRHSPQSSTAAVSSPQVTTASTSAPSPVATTLIAPPREVAATPQDPRPDGASAPGTVTKYRGGLRIDSHPVGATVFVNNQRVGQTPIALSSLPVGSRAVRVELNGYAAWSRVVQIVANQSASVSAHLEATR